LYTIYFCKAILNQKILSINNKKIDLRLSERFAISESRQHSKNLTIVEE